jgi:hypothetical protein
MSESSGVRVRNLGWVSVDVSVMRSPLRKGLLVGGWHAT